METTLLATTTTNQEIYMDNESLEHMKAHSDVDFEHIKEGISKIDNYNGAYGMIGVDLGHTIGYSNCVETPDRNKVFTLKRAGRAIDTTTVFGIRPIETSIITIGLANDVKVDGKNKMFTAFYGPLAPKEPTDPTLSDAEREEAVKFWSKHALTLEKPDGNLDLERINWEVSIEGMSPEELKRLASVMSEYNIKLSLLPKQLTAEIQKVKSAKDLTKEEKMAKAKKSRDNFAKNRLEHYSRVSTDEKVPTFADNDSLIKALTNPNKGEEPYSRIAACIGVIGNKNCPKIDIFIEELYNIDSELKKNEELAKKLINGTDKEREEAFKEYLPETTKMLEEIFEGRENKNIKPFLNIASRYIGFEFERLTDKKIEKESFKGKDKKHNNKQFNNSKQRDNKQRDDKQNNNHQYRAEKPGNAEDKPFEIGTWHTNIPGYIVFDVHDKKNPKKDFALKMPLELFTDQKSAAKLVMLAYKNKELPEGVSKQPIGKGKTTWSMADELNNIKLPDDAR